LFNARTVLDLSVSEIDVELGGKEIGKLTKKGVRVWSASQLDGESKAASA
jgi:hypothetical protein